MLLQIRFQKKKKLKLQPFTMRKHKRKDISRNGVLGFRDGGFGLLMCGR